jgi:hypothetical protein
VAGFAGVIAKEKCTFTKTWSLLEIGDTVHLKTEDAALLPLIRRFVDVRPTYGYRRITALANRELTRTGLAVVNRKRVRRIMQQAALLFERHTGRRAKAVSATAR